MICKVPLDDILTVQRGKPVYLDYHWMDGCCIRAAYRVVTREDNTTILGLGLSMDSDTLNKDDVKVRLSLFANFQDSPSAKVQTQQLVPAVTKMFTDQCKTMIRNNPFKMTLDELALSKFVVDGMISFYIEVEIAMSS